MPVIWSQSCGLGFKYRSSIPKPPVTVVWGQGCGLGVVCDYGLKWKFGYNYESRCELVRQDRTRMLESALGLGLRLGLTHQCATMDFR